MQMREQLDVIPRYTFFLEGVKAHVSKICDLMALGDIPMEDPRTVFEIVHSAPEWKTDLSSVLWQQGAFNQCCKAAYMRTKGSDKEEAFLEAFTYFTEYVPRLSQCAKDMLHDAVIGVLMGVWDSERKHSKELSDAEPAK